MEEQDPFFIENEDFLVTKQILAGQHEMQIEFIRLMSGGFVKNLKELHHLGQCAQMLGYPWMFDQYTEAFKFIF